MAVSLKRIVEECDRTLRTAEIKDYDGAVNGLQVENRGHVSRVAAAVDATAATVRLAIEECADLLLVHHGLFWGTSHPWTGKRYDLIRTLVENNLAIYSSHLPLDMHPKLGNNAQLAAALGFKKVEPFFVEKAQAIGLQTLVKVPRGKLARKLGMGIHHGRRCGTPRGQFAQRV